ncbi:ABC transporter substrate-binding protein [Treponema primitia]|uniref:ABC transporter substrate-binding protein n=1 Tax=Treponema primitia TaxID=88058 RepID=UPI00025550F0|nr:ABC transporter substrate-binding protein [Treponema primitia]
MKQFFSTISVLLILSVATAFAGGGRQPGQSASGDTSKQVTIDWYWVENLEEPDNDLISSEISKLVQPRINSKVQMHVFDWGSYTTKIDLMLAAGEKIDLVSTVTLPFHQMVAKDYFLPLDELYANYGKEMAQYMNPYNLEGCRVNGKLYAIPTPKEAGGCYGYLIRKDYVEATGVDLSKVKTMEDMTAIWAKFKAYDPNFSIYNNAIAYIDLMGFQVLGDGPGRIYKNEKAEVVNEFEHPAFQEIAKLWHQWYEAGYINKETATPNFAHTAALRDNKIQALGGQCKEGIEAEVGSGIGGKYEFVKVIIQPPIALTFSGYECAFAIPRNSANPERVMMYLNLLLSDPAVHNLANFGIEGRNYVTLADGRIDFPKGVDAANLTYIPNAIWENGNAFISKWWNTYPVDHPARLRFYNTTVQPSVALGFTFDADPVKSEIGACANVTNEFRYAILSGAQPLENYLTRMQQQYKAAGIDKIIAEKQKQLAAWLATKK